MTAASRRTRLILLGTAGGPSPKKARAAPAQVVIVDGVPYVIDTGNGVARQLVQAGVMLRDLRAVFVTHHHSDHNADYGNLMLLAWGAGLHTPVDTYGPPPLARMTELALQLNDYDIQIRMVDEGRVPLAPLIRPHEITAPGLVMRDERVTVTCTLADHPPVKPAFAFRFDGPDRSIVISGDTAYSEAVIALAQGADVLVHEVLHVPSLDALVSSLPNASREGLKQHLIASHTSTVDAGRVAARAGVKTLVLSHYVPGEFPPVNDAEWLAGARTHFSGDIVLGRDLLEV
jgi:ribonuclease BN (tRNA processing enzyme)